VSSWMKTDRPGLKAVTVARSFKGILLVASATDKARSWAALVMTGEALVSVDSCAWVAGIRAQKAKKPINIQHPTSDIQRPLKLRRAGRWIFDVGCWRLDVFNWTRRSIRRAEPRNTSPKGLWTVAQSRLRLESLSH